MDQDEADRLAGRGAREVAAFRAQHIGDPFAPGHLCSGCATPKPVGRLTVVRDVDGTTIDYTVDVPPRRLVDIMRAEQLKPGSITSTYYSEGHHGTETNPTATDERMEDRGRGIGGASDEVGEPMADR